MTGPSRLVLLTLFVCAGAFAEEAGEKSSARFVSGRMPTASPLAATSGLAALAVEVDEGGEVSRMTALVGSEPFVGAVEGVVSGWRFVPAERDGEAAPSEVLVAAAFSIPALSGTNPLAPGILPSPPADEAARVPFPTRTVLADFPPSAFTAGTVLVAVEVDGSGRVTKARVAVSAGGLDEAALAAASQWTFRPASRDGKTVPATAYLAFVFRPPIASTEERADGL